jgi:uncharacterized protein DUF6338
VDEAWTRIGGLDEPVFVELDLGEDASIFGYFASESFATTSPHPPGVFLEAEYAEDGDTMVEIDTSRGVYVEASNIRSISFYSPQELSEQLWEEGSGSGVRDPGASGGQPPPI